MTGQPQYFTDRQELRLYLLPSTLDQDDMLQEKVTKKKCGLGTLLQLFGIAALLLLCWMKLLLLKETSVKVSTMFDTVTSALMRVHFNITFDALACEDSHVESMDANGDQMFDDTLGTV